jgi:hypothetical protein
MGDGLKTAQALAQRARIVLACATGKTNTVVAEKMQLTNNALENGAADLSTSALHVRRVERKAPQRYEKKKQQELGPRTAVARRKRR